MIRINLIGEGKRPAVARKPKITTAGRELANWALVALIVVGVLVTLGHYLALRSTAKQKDREIAAAQREADELAPIIAEVEQYKANRAELQRKIRVINNLKANQQGPVQIMDEISSGLPELLWLERLEVKGNTISLWGQAFNPNAVANLIDNLDQVEQFREPVLKDLTERGRVYNFVINFDYSFVAEESGEGEIDEIDTMEVGG